MIHYHFWKLTKQIVNILNMKKQNNKKTNIISLAVRRNRNKD